jgi:hypothetical protein
MASLHFSAVSPSTTTRAKYPAFQYWHRVLRIWRRSAAEASSSCPAISKASGTPTNVPGGLARPLLPHSIGHDDNQARLTVQYVSSSSKAHYHELGRVRINVELIVPLKVSPQGARTPRKNIPVAVFPARLRTGQEPAAGRASGKAKSPCAIMTHQPRGASPRFSKNRTLARSG